MTRMIFVMMVLVLMLCACGSGFSIEPLGEQSFGAETAQVQQVRFRSDDFSVVGDLRIPVRGERHPAVILVHGSGDATRNGAVPFGPLIELFLRNNYAVLSWDKPGSGGSTGKLEDGQVITQRAQILADGIKLLSEHPSIDATRIGLWGISQAGWVMPLALELSEDVAFMVVVSGGGEDGIDQMAYQVGRQVLAAGGSPEQAADADRSWSRMARATTYREYRAAMETLVGISQVRDRYPLEIAEEEAWSAWPPESDAFFNPMTVIEHTTIPTLVFFGELDENIDPVQGAEAYEVALSKAGNGQYCIEVIPGAAHVFVTWPQHLDTLETWLGNVAD